MKTHNIALLPGDGIGPEIIAEGRKVIDAVAQKERFKVKWTPYPFGADHYLATKELLNEDALKEMGKMDAIYLGALGDPRVTPGVLEKGVLLALRFYFDQYVNLRPIKLLEGIECPLKNKGPKDIDFYVVRENTEDFYVGIGGAIPKGKSKQLLEVKRTLYNVKFNLDIEADGDELAYQIGVLSSKGSRRVIKYAFELAKKKNKTRVTAVDKANVLETSRLWRLIATDIATKNSDVAIEHMLVDTAAMRLITSPASFDIMVTENTFGDILTDEASVLAGSMGMLPSASLGDKGPGLYEPIHGSAPDIAGKAIANPVGSILSSAMLLRHSLGLEQEALAIEGAADRAITDGCRTADLGGKLTTQEMTQEIIDRITEK